MIGVRSRDPYGVTPGVAVSVEYITGQDAGYNLLLELVVLGVVRRSFLGLGDIVYRDIDSLSDRAKRYHSLTINDGGRIKPQRPKLVPDLCLVWAIRIVSTILARADIY